MKIDLVYLWVDGNDIKWQKEKQKWQKILEINQKNNTLNDCRYIDNEELRYSLRSVAKNMPWINHIYIITDGQTPNWLDTNHPKISIINHKEIMPEDALPTFNSEALETCIHKIPNLSEHFIYGNDDLFVYKSLTPFYFFDYEGNPVIRLVKQNWSKSRIKERPYLRNIAFSIDLVMKHFNKQYKYESTHNFDAYRKSFCIECEKEFEEDFIRARYHKFRTLDSVQRIIFNLFALAKKKHKLRILRIRSRITKLENLYIRLNHPIKMDRKINSHAKKLKLFCINDNERATQENRLLLKPYLEFLFPNKQDWEI